MLRNRKTAIRIGLRIFSSAREKGKQTWKMKLDSFLKSLSGLHYICDSIGPQEQNWDDVGKEKKRTKKQKAKPTSRLLLSLSMSGSFGKAKITLQMYLEEYVVLDSDSNLELCCRCSEFPQKNLLLSFPLGSLGWENSLQSYTNLPEYYSQLLKWHSSEWYYFTWKIKLCPRCSQQAWPILAMDCLHEPHVLFLGRALPDSTLYNLAFNHLPQLGKGFICLGITEVTRTDVEKTYNDSWHLQLPPAISVP